MSDLAGVLQVGAAILSPLASLGLLAVFAFRQRQAEQQQTAMLTRLAQLTVDERAGLSAILERLGERLERSIKDEAGMSRRETNEAARLARDELAHRVDALRGQLGADAQQGRLEATASFTNLASMLKGELTAFASGVDKQLVAIQADNGVKLEEMRRTVAEKLEGTLERRLGDSFKMVSERLELVHKGLGEMQTLAVGVGDLKKVMTNVKTRGTWGEIQLGSMLEQILAPEQFSANVETKKDTGCRVEFAIKMPNRDGGGSIWLPIDAKFPLEDYHRLVTAQDNADPVAAELEGAKLEAFIKAAAKDICDKYIGPPDTTDFAVMYLPTEGLFAEVARRTAILEMIQRDFRVVVAGPTTLAALLNSLQMGFRTLAIQKRSSEVWEILGAVKSEFGRFDDILKKVEKKLQEAGNVIETVHVRSRMINKKLRNVQELPAEDASKLLAIALSETPANAEL